MRVVLVGGAGEVGSEIARDLAHVAEIDDAADRRCRPRAAAALAEELRPLHPSVAPRRARRQRPRLGQWPILDGADVLMNCTSFTLFDQVLALGRRRRRSITPISSPSPTTITAGRRGGGDHRDFRAGSIPDCPTCSSATPRSRSTSLHEVEISWLSCARSLRRPGCSTRSCGSSPRTARPPLLPRWPPPPGGVHGGIAPGGLRSSDRPPVRVLRAPHRGARRFPATSPRCVTAPSGGAGGRS